jgi:diacylglycerol kinase
VALSALVRKVCSENEMRQVALATSFVFVCEYFLENNKRQVALAALVALVRKVGSENVEQ